MEIMMPVYDVKLHLMSSHLWDSMSVSNSICFVGMLIDDDDFIIVGRLSKNSRWMSDGGRESVGVVSDLMIVEPAGEEDPPSQSFPTINSLHQADSINPNR